MKTQGTLENITLDYLSRRTIVSFAVDAKPAEIEGYRDMQLDVSFDKHREKRSQDANRMYWACVGELAKVLRTSKDELHLIMLRRYGESDYLLIKKEALKGLKEHWRDVEIVGTGELNGETMVQVLCYYPSHTYNSKEFSILLDGVVSEMKEVGLQPPPSEEMQQAIRNMEKKENEKRDMETTRGIRGCMQRITDEVH